MSINFMDMGLAAQAASIGKALPDYSIVKIPCPNCRGFLVDAQDRPCTRCDRTGFIEVKRQHVERKQP